MLRPPAIWCSAYGDAWPPDSRRKTPTSARLQDHARTRQKLARKSARNAHGLPDGELASCGLGAKTLQMSRVARPRGFEALTFGSVERGSNPGTARRCSPALWDGIPSCTSSPLLAGSAAQPTCGGTYNGFQNAGPEAMELWDSAARTRACVQPRVQRAPHARWLGQSRADHNPRVGGSSPSSGTGRKPR
jgi:hypothetical protein